MPVFFEHTRAFLDANANLFDFLWTAAAGLWNLRWQIDGFARATGGYNDAHARSRFVAGSEILGVNLRRICVDESWNLNKERLALVALTLAVSNFESWLSEVVAYHISGTGDLKKDRNIRTAIASDLQKPSEYAKALRKIGNPPSSIMTRCIAPALTAEHAAELGSLPGLVAVYRHFKDLRNKLSHEGGRADRQLVDSFNAAQSLSASSLSIALPEMKPVSLGAPISLSLRGVVGATGVIIQVVKAYDATLASSQQAESSLVNRWRAKWGSQAGKYNLEPKRRQSKLMGRLRALGLATPHHVAELDAFLRLHKLALE